MKLNIKMKLEFWDERRDNGYDIIGFGQQQSILGNEGFFHHSAKES